MLQVRVGLHKNATIVPRVSRKVRKCLRVEIPVHQLHDYRYSETRSGCRIVDYVKHRLVIPLTRLKSERGVRMPLPHVVEAPVVASRSSEKALQASESVDETAQKCHHVAGAGDGGFDDAEFVFGYMLSEEHSAGLTRPCA